MKLNVYGIAYPVCSLGPGRRVVLWTAGCSRCCPGCVSPELQKPESGRSMDVSIIIGRMKKLELLVDGITISGGEPLEQASGLLAFLSGLKNVLPNWSVILYTGFELHEIKNDESMANVIEFVDVLIDGPYMEGVSSTSFFTGSGNQTIHFLSSDGAVMSDYFFKKSSLFDVALGSGDLAVLVGVGEPDRRAAVYSGLGAGESAAEEATT